MHQHVAARTPHAHVGQGYLLQGYLLARGRAPCIRRLPICAASLRRSTARSRSIAVRAYRALLVGRSGRADHLTVPECVAGAPLQREMSRVQHVPLPAIASPRASLRAPVVV